MFKVIKIGGKSIPMKSSGNTGRLYQTYFKKDILAEFIKLSSKEYENISITLEELAWTMAKTANNKIPDITEWLEQFDGMFDIVSSYDQIMELMGSSFSSSVSRKKKKHNSQKKK